MLASISNWFVLLFVRVVIRWTNYFGIGLTTLNRSMLPSQQQNNSLMKSVCFEWKGTAMKRNYLPLYKLWLEWKLIELHGFCVNTEKRVTIAHTKLLFWVLWLMRNTRWRITVLLWLRYTLLLLNQSCVVTQNWQALSETISTFLVEFITIAMPT